MRKAKTAVLLLTSLAALAACGSNGGGSGKYTYHGYVSGSPTTWNPHTWEDNSYDEIVGYSEIGFVDFTYDPEVEGGYKVVYEMADSIEDVSTNANIVDKDFIEKWGIPTSDDGSVEAGHVWQIDLNQAAKFASGTVINADTYVESMKRCLSPEMKNYRANSYYTGDFSIPGAYEYYHSGDTTYVSVLQVPDKGVTYDENQLFLDLPNSPLWGEAFNCTYEEACDESWGYAEYFINSNKENVILKYKDQIEYTDELLAELATCPIWKAVGLTNDDGSVNMTYVLAYTASYSVTFEEKTFDSVGLLKTGDYQLLYITENSVDEFNFLVNSTSLWIVNPELYDSLITETAGVKTSSYGTSVDSYDSFGPYKLATFEKDKQFTFTRNDNWYGWTDGEHAGQFKTTDIVVDVIKEHATALLAFEKGDLDGIDLAQSDMSKYGTSDYMLYTPQTYTMRLVFDSNVNDLKALEVTADDGKNKQNHDRFPLVHNKRCQCKPKIAAFLFFFLFHWSPSFVSLLFSSIFCLF